MGYSRNGESTRKGAEVNEELFIYWSVPSSCDKAWCNAHICSLFAVVHWEQDEEFVGLTFDRLDARVATDRSLVNHAMGGNVQDALPCDSIARRQRRSTDCQGTVGAVRVAAFSVPLTTHLVFPYQWRCSCQSLRTRAHNHERVLVQVIFSTKAQRSVYPWVKGSVQRRQR
jgi:hypothetical protein